MTESKPQELCTSFAARSAFEAGQLRSYFADRDLGVARATNGLVTAIVHKANGPCPEDVARKHHHDVEFQMNYVLKGSVRFAFDGIGEFEFGAGDAWTQPPGIKHTLLSFTEDFEVLEIVMPAEFPTIDD